MGWVLVPDLVALRDEFDELAPDRDHSSDGSIGDPAHQAEVSGHNPDDTKGVATEGSDPDTIPEVHAIDVDADLRKPGWSMERAVQIVVDRHRRGVDNRLNYVIYNRRIWARAYGWVEREYFGANPHDKHAHFSSRFGSGSAAQGNPEADLRPWGLLEAEENDVDEATMDKIADKVAERLRIGDKGVMDKLGEDLNNDKSGVAIGIRRQVKAANADGGAATR
jgi:hypothetical protein